MSDNLTQLEARYLELAQERERDTAQRALAGTIISAACISWLWFLNTQMFTWQLVLVIAVIACGAVVLAFMSLQAFRRLRKLKPRPTQQY